MFKKSVFALLMPFLFSLTFIGCEPEESEDKEICNNNQDDDGDGLVDCADMECWGHVGSPNGQQICQSSESHCDDGFDNDANGEVDCDDPNCADDPVCNEEETETDCTDGVDNDGDGDVDCDDSDCADDPACSEVETDCTDGVDNDGDGDVDCDDEDCLDDPACITPDEDCTDGSDNDGDGDIDCADADCDGQTGPDGQTCELPESSCNDGYDNDGDGDVDCDDSDCADDSACIVGETDCTDGVDNDSDGDIDCADAECEGETGPDGQTCELPESSCNDGYDNDGDGDVDCDDSDCTIACLNVGDLIITELMKDPNQVSDNNGEWFELYNSSARDIDLRDLVIFSQTSGGNDATHLITASGEVVIPAGEYAVLSINGDTVTNGGISVLYEYSNINLSNGGDNLGIRTVDGTVLDEVAYDEIDYHDMSGMSLSLDRDYLSPVDNDDSANWCYIVKRYNASDYGTPGEANPSCLRETNCNDTTDNDGNGLVDCEDFACAFDSNCTSYNVPGSGDLIITEIMADPGIGTPDSEYEWIEIYNTSIHTMELNGLVLCDSSYDQHCFFLTHGSSMGLDSGNYAVFGYKSENVPGAISVIEYDAAIMLSNSSDGVTLMRDHESSTPVIIDYVNYDAMSGWDFMTTGASLQFSSDATQSMTLNDDPVYWCAATTVYDATNLLMGTPGSVNDVCEIILPETDCDDGVDNDSDGLTDCLDGDCDGLAGDGGTCEYGYESSCSDGFDNDGDGLVDSADPDCATGGSLVAYFSEYVEGSSNNKALEIYIQDASGVMVLSDCEINKYSNGGLTPTNITLDSTSLVSGDLWVICNNSADASLSPYCDQFEYQINFNGNDAVELVCNGVTMDVIGEIGDDTYFGEDTTERRNAGISSGDPNGSDAFDFADEWTSFALDTFDGLGVR
ncbi:MAG: lamin tail domain-containing protein [Myxococcota bacterium]